MVWRWTALSIAARKGYTEVVSALLKAGAEVDAGDRSGWTPLIWAAYENRVQTTEILLKNGAATYKSDVHGRTALMIAERLAHAHVVRQIEGVLSKGTAGTEIEQTSGLSMVIQSSHPAATSIAFSHDGTYLASGGIDNTVKLWSSDGRLIRTISGHRDSVTCVAFTPDVQHLVSGSMDGTVKIWSLYGDLVRELRIPSEGVNDLSIHPDGKHIAVAADRTLGTGMDNTLTLWRIEGQMVRSFKHSGEDIKSAAISPDGTYIASSGEDGTIYLWKTSGDLVHALEHHSDTVASVAFSPDGNKIVSAGVDGTINLWSIKGEILWSKDAQTGSIFDICFSADGESIFSAGSHKDRGSIMEWSLTGERIRAIEDDSSVLNSIDFGDHGKIASAGAGSRTSIKLWSAGGELIKAIKGQRRSKYYSADISSSPDGNQIQSKNWGESWSKAATWSNDGRLIQSRLSESPGSKSQPERQDGSSRLRQLIEKRKDWHLGGYRNISSWCRSEREPDSLYFATLDWSSDYYTIDLWRTDLIPDLDPEKKGRISEVILDKRNRTTHLEWIIENESRESKIYSFDVRRVRIIDDRHDRVREIFVD
jgi:WD40 repeat protein